jgi:high affinity Mn2+ porin
MNLEQEVTGDLGAFARAGFASGDVEPDSYTDIDRTVAAGLSLTGKRWGRPDDTSDLQPSQTQLLLFTPNSSTEVVWGFSLEMLNCLTPGLEHIMETYYQFPIYAWKVMFDYQFVANPAYNRDRGPVSILDSGYILSSSVMVRGTALAMPAPIVLIGGQRTRGCWRIRAGRDARAELNPASFVHF